MLSDGLLRSRHDEIARCLSSRKRKLSELYYATATFPHPSNAGGHREPLARQKEAAFLEANDLSKGRLYDEHTLPERPRLETVLAENEIKHGPPRADELDRPQAPASQPVPGITSHQLPAQGRPFADSTQPQLTVSSAGVQTTEQPETGQSVHLPHRQPNGVDTSHAQHASEAAAKPTSPKTTAQATTQTTAHPLSPAETNRTSSFNDRLGVAPIIVPPKVAEAASSPMSTGPSSSHTSATERSPASSSTESVASIAESPSVGKISTDEPASNAQSQPMSAVVPSTPDEQLQLEAAMSIRNSTTPKQPVTSHDKDGDQHMAEAPADLKESQLKREPTESVTNSRPSSSSGPQTAPDVKHATKAVESRRQPAEQQYPRPERMTTRVASGAIRHKSVSEILGESPKPSATPETEQHSRDSRRSSVFDKQAGTSQTSPASPSKLRLSERPDKERSKLSTVVFPKTSSQEKEKAMQLACRRDEETRKSPNEEQDYLYTLFQAKAHYPPRTMSLNTLLSTAHKTLSTSNHFLEYHEQMDCRTLKRIYQLQHSNRWALRQLQRSPEPSRQVTHWDIMLDHVKWMRMDFREERKWKLTAAKRCAEWCAEYVASDEDGRRSLRVPVKLPSPPATEAPDTDKLMDGHPDEALPNNHPTPDLIHSADDDSVSDGFNDDHPDFDDGNVPAAIFSSGSDEFTFRMERTMASEKILGELPFYCPVQIVPETNKPAFKVQPDDVWKTQLLPVSKYAQGTIQFKEDGPPRKRSRYDYEQDTYHDGEEENAYRSLLPEQMDVALFSSEYKALRDRIHPGNAFRPPTEYIMPPLGFYESRQSSHWTLAEDDELRKLVQEYSFNWSLIASCLAPRSSFVSTSDRRTPWECFERWINLEGLPPDMAKTPYFRTYNARLEAAQRTIMNAQQQAIQQQQQQQQNGGQVNPGAQAMIRRRTAQPLRVERKRSSRHLALLAGMRKLSQKRETNLQKQQHATQLASMRKVNEATQPRPPISTPQEFSQLKHERELKFLEKQEQYRQQMIAHQRAAMAQRAAQLNPSGQFNGIPVRPPASVPNGAGGVQVPIANGLANGIPNGVGVSQSRPHPGMAAMPNGLPATGPIPVSGGMPMKMMPQQGLQQPISGRPGLPIQTSPDNSRIIREANRLQEQQRLLQSRQQQHQFHGGQQGFVPQQGPHSSPNMNATPATAGNNPALMAAFQTATNGGSPSFAASSLAPGMMPAASPRMNHPSTPLNNAPALPNLNNIQASLQRLHPTMSQEQISKLATERLQQYQQQQQRLSQAALNAAAGNLGVSNLPPNYQAGNSGQQIPQQGTVNGVPSVPLQNQTQGYMNRLGVSQANGQQNRPGVGIASPAMTNMLMHQSRSATPQSQRPASSQGAPQQQQQPPQQSQPQQTQPPQPGKSPRPPQAQAASS